MGVWGRIGIRPQVESKHPALPVRGGPGNMETSEELKNQIETAFQYRGHITVALADGNSVEGYLYNREFTNPRLSEDNFIDLFLKDSGNPARYKIADIRSVMLTGTNEAEGKSYQDWMAKKKRETSHE
jgi:hypothetical protein